MSARHVTVCSCQPADLCLALLFTATLLLCVWIHGHVLRGVRAQQLQLQLQLQLQQGANASWHCSLSGINSLVPAHCRTGDYSCDEEEQKNVEPAQGKSILRPCGGSALFSF
jgi:hypothetical protein